MKGLSDHDELHWRQVDWRGDGLTKLYFTELFRRLIKQIGERGPSRVPDSDVALLAEFSSTGKHPFVSDPPPTLNVHRNRETVDAAR